MKSKLKSWNDEFLFFKLDHFHILYTQRLRTHILSKQRSVDGDQLIPEFYGTRETKIGHLRGQTKKTKNQIWHIIVFLLRRLTFDNFQRLKNDGILLYL